MGIEIRRFDDPISDPSLHVAHNAFDNEMLLDEDPTFGERLLQDTAARLAHHPADHVLTRWLAFDEDRIVAEAALYLDVEDVANSHLGWVELGVVPPGRRRGLGSELLLLAARQAEAAGRRLLMGESNSLVPAGRAFCAAKGFEAGLVERISQLVISDLDIALMESWSRAGRDQEDRFELFWLDGRWPAAMLDDVVALSHVMNDAPFDDLDWNDQAFTTTHVVAEEDEIFERGFTRYTAAVIERASGRMAGYTQLFINPSFPDLGQQGNTGVLSEFRGNRLGKWLKAETALYLVEHHPEITRVRTGNANSNAPMLAINEAMGFKPHHDTTVWQRATADVVSA